MTPNPLDDVVAILQIIGWVFGIVAWVRCFALQQQINELTQAVREVGERKP
jgi:hypothetical protein